MNDTPQEKSPEAEGGSPIWMIVCMVIALFAASYFVRSNTAPTDDSAARARTLSSETPDDIMPAAFKDHLPWNPDAKGVIKGNMGLQYIVLKEGRKDGKRPVATDRVSVNYEGRLATGEKFDSSFDRGAPAQFRLNQVIPESLFLAFLRASYGRQIPSMGAPGLFFARLIA